MFRRHLIASSPVEREEAQAAYRIKKSLAAIGPFKFRLAATILALLIAAAFIFGSTVRSVQSN